MAEWRCPECRTRRKDWKLFQQHLRATGHKVCQCGGYHYGHRKGSPYCNDNPLSPVLQAHRQGCDVEDLQRIAEGILKDAPHLEERLRYTCSHMGFTFKRNT